MYFIILNSSRWSLAFSFLIMRFLISSFSRETFISYPLVSRIDRCLLTFWLAPKAMTRVKLRERLHFKCFFFLFGTLCLNWRTKLQLFLTFSKCFPGGRFAIWLYQRFLSKIRASLGINMETCLLDTEFNKFCYYMVIHYPRYPFRPIFNKTISVKN